MNAKASVALCAAILCGFCAWRVTQVHDAHPTTEERAISLLRFMRSLNQDTKVSEEELENAINASLACIRREITKICPVKLNNTLHHFDLIQECGGSTKRLLELDHYTDSCVKHFPDAPKEVDVEELAKMFERCLPSDVFSSVWTDVQIPNPSEISEKDSDVGELLS